MQGLTSVQGLPKFLLAALVKTEAMCSLCQTFIASDLRKRARPGLHGCGDQSGSSQAANSSDGDV